MMIYYRLSGMETESFPETSNTLMFSGGSREINFGKELF
jgi:hypothetical protein